MGFVAVWQFELPGGQRHQQTVAGAVSDGMFSSTTAELMALLVVATLLPGNITAVVKCDSWAAIEYMDQLQREWDHCWQKSPLAYMACWYVAAVRARTEPIVLEWVRGHSGAGGNEMADRAAKAAQRHPPFWWTLRLGAPTQQRYWVCHEGRVGPKRIGGLIKAQEEQWMIATTQQQLEKAAGQPLKRARVVETLEALNWSAADASGGFTRKNAWCKTSTRDTNIRGFVLGALLGNLPVAQREWAWYPKAYPETEMRQCPWGCAAAESQAHFFSCPRSRQARQEERGTTEHTGNAPEERWAAQQIGRPNRYIGIPRDWEEGSIQAVLGTRVLQGTQAEALQWVADLLPKDIDSLTKRSQVLRKVTARRRWEELYEGHWKPRCAMQIDREKNSRTQPSTRRRRMRQEQPRDEARASGVPRFERTMRTAPFESMCRRVVDRLSRGKPSSGTGSRNVGGTV
ncbi:hypothetical protein H4R20_006492 [Coemansia guatemalensis]|uniref:RNase H type-1 domain-containing protein n=1 Tax=Coemansia guatemalensis TaxID=2761395 RepID=A0A9W8LR49_9FUNG|nr:hypothetical protein H4R20_006492 [Coemansia guatemalensis]